MSLGQFSASWGFLVSGLWSSDLDSSRLACPSHWLSCVEDFLTLVAAGARWPTACCCPYFVDEALTLQAANKSNIFSKPCRAASGLKLPRV